jgi:hypothetical protein
MSKARTLLAFVPVLVLGCAPVNPNAPAHVHGSVTYNGQPVTGGTITLYSEDAGLYTIPIRQDGTFSESDLPKGTMKVTIETESVNTTRPVPQYGAGRREAKAAPKGGSPGQAAAGPAAAQVGVRQRSGGMGSPLPTNVEHVHPGAYVKIPRKYSDVRASGLTVTLERGNQQKDFNLTD